MNLHAFYVFVVFATATVLGLVGAPLPVSVPPLPEEPALLRVAPADAMAFLAWSGTAPLPGDPKNRTVRLAAEPEVRAAVAQLRRALVGALERDGGGLAARVADVALTALEHPGCVFVQRYRERPRPDLAGGIAVRMGDALPRATELLEALEPELQRLPQGQRHEDQVVDGVTFRALPTDTQHAFVGWAATDGWLLLAIGTATPAAMVAGLRGRSEGLGGSARYREVAAPCAVAQPSTRAFLDLAALRETVTAGGGAHALRLLDALGLGAASAAASCAGLEGDGFCSRVRIAVPGRTGLLGALAGAPLAQDGLALVPVDADVAVSLRADPQQFATSLFATFDALFGADEPRLEREVARELERELSLRWREDLLAHLDGQVTLWNAPSQGGALFTAACGAFALRDGAAFARVLQQVNATIARHLPDRAAMLAKRRFGRDPSLESFEHAGTRVHWIDPCDDDVPFGVSWAATRSNLLLALQPQPLRDTLDAGDPPNPDRSLARLPVVNRRGAATALLHLNTRELVARTYGPALVLFQAAAREWQREGFDFDLADVPRLSALLPHLDREQLLLEPVDGGFALQRTGTLPLADPLVVLLAAGIAGLVAEL